MTMRMPSQRPRERTPPSHVESHPLLLRVAFSPSRVLIGAACTHRKTCGVEWRGLNTRKHSKNIRPPKNDHTIQSASSPYNIRSPFGPRPSVVAAAPTMLPVTITSVTHVSPTHAEGEPLILTDINRVCGAAFFEANTNDLRTWAIGSTYSSAMSSVLNEIRDLRMHASMIASGIVGPLQEHDGVVDRTRYKVLHRKKKLLELNSSLANQQLVTLTLPGFESNGEVIEPMDAKVPLQLDTKATLLLPLDENVMSWVVRRCRVVPGVTRRAEHSTPAPGSGVYWHKGLDGWLAKRKDTDGSDQAYKVFKSNGAVELAAGEALDWARDSGA